HPTSHLFPYTTLFRSYLAEEAREWETKCSTWNTLSRDPHRRAPLAPESRSPFATSPRPDVDQGFRRPTRRRRRKEFGTGIGSRHSQVGTFNISGRSWDPIHKTTSFAATCPECAQFKKTGYSPRARAQAKSSGAISSPSSS